MRRHLIVSIIMFMVALAAAIMLIEGCVYRDEQAARRPSEAELQRAFKLADYHGTDTVYRRDGVWYFDRNGVRCRLEGRGA
jgi:flagellar basal body-associated protein FliL